MIQDTTKMVWFGIDNPKDLSTYFYIIIHVSCYSKYYGFVHGAIIQFTDNHPTSTTQVYCTGDTYIQLHVLIQNKSNSSLYSK